MAATLTTTQIETTSSTETTVLPTTSTSTSFITVLTTGTVCGPTGGTCNAAVDYLYPTISFATMTTVVPVTHTVVSTLYATSCPLAIETTSSKAPSRTGAIIGGAIAGAAVVTILSIIIWRKKLKRKWTKFLRPPPVAAKNVNTNFGKVHGNMNVGDKQMNEGSKYNYGPSEPAPDLESAVPASTGTSTEKLNPDSPVQAQDSERMSIHSS